MGQDRDPLTLLKVTAFRGAERRMNTLKHGILAHEIVLRGEDDGMGSHRAGWAVIANHGGRSPWRTSRHELAGSAANATFSYGNICIRQLVIPARMMVTFAAIEGTGDV